MNNISRLNLISDDPKFIVKPHDVSGERGQDINMTCLVDGNPPPSYTWFKNGNMNYVSSNFYISMIYPLDLLKTKYIKLNHYVLRAWKTFNVASWVQTPIFKTQMS